MRAAKARLIKLACEKIPRKMDAGRAIGAVVAQQLYTLWVGGSNPSSPTNFHFIHAGGVPFQCKFQTKCSPDLLDYDTVMVIPL